MDEITVDKFSSTRNVTVLHCTVENQGYVFLKNLYLLCRQDRKRHDFFLEKLEIQGVPRKRDDLKIALI